MNEYNRKESILQTHSSFFSSGQPGRLTTFVAAYTIEA